MGGHGEECPQRIISRCSGGKIDRITLQEEAAESPPHLEGSLTEAKILRMRLEETLLSALPHLATQGEVAFKYTLISLLNNCLFTAQMALTKAQVTWAEQRGVAALGFDPDHVNFKAHAPQETAPSSQLPLGVLCWGVGCCWVTTDD